MQSRLLQQHYRRLSAPYDSGCEVVMLPAAEVAPRLLTARSLPRRFKRRSGDPLFGPTVSPPLWHQ